MNRRAAAHSSGRLMARLHLACMFSNMILTPNLWRQSSPHSLLYQGGVVELLRETGTTARFAFTRR